MAITYIEALWWDAAGTECSCTCRSSDHLVAIVSMVYYTASRDFRPSAACPAGQRLRSSRVPGDLVCRAGSGLLLLLLKLSIRDCNLLTPYM